MIEDFADKLALMLKAVSLSRGRLAANLGVDKSVVSRWASGVNAPSDDNLVRLTHQIAVQRPGFTLIDWDRDLTSLSAMVGGGLAVAAPEAISRDGAVADWLHGAALGDAIAASARATAACAGFWRVTQPSIVLPPMFFHQYMIMAPAADGLLKFQVGYFDVRFEGWAFAVRNQLYFVGSDVLRGNQLYGIYNLPAAERADLLEGVALTCLPDVGGMPGSQLCVFERIGVLSGDAAADQRHYEELSQKSPVATADSASDGIRRFLMRDGLGPLVNPASLTLPYVDSISRGAGWDEAVNAVASDAAPRVPRTATIAPTLAVELPSLATAAGAPMLSLPFGLMETAEKQTARRARAYVGRWKVTRLSASGKLIFLVEHLLIRPKAWGCGSNIMRRGTSSRAGCWSSTIACTRWRPTTATTALPPICSTVSLVRAPTVSTAC